MLPSGNDSAYVLADYFGAQLMLLPKYCRLIKDQIQKGHILAHWKIFVEEMNSNADRLNLTQTHYANPHGLCSRENKSTAEDVGKLALQFLEFERLKKVVSTAEYEAAVYNPIKKCFRIIKWKNTNKMLQRNRPSPVPQERNY